MVKRKNASVKSWKEKYNDLCSNSESVVSLQKELEEATAEVKKLTVAKRKQSRRFKEKVYAVQDALGDTKAAAAIEVEEVSNRARLERRSLEEDVSQVMEQLQESLDDADIIPVKEDGKSFSADVRETSYKLQSLGRV